MDLTKLKCKTCYYTFSTVTCCADSFTVCPQCKAQSLMVLPAEPVQPAKKTRRTPR